MKKDEFEQFWAALTHSQKGAAVEAYFHDVHEDATAVRAGSVDFELNGRKYDIKGHKNACPRLDSVHQKNDVSILWYNWMSASNAEDDFPVVIRSVTGMETFEMVSFQEFSEFIVEYKKNKQVRRKLPQGEHTKSVNAYLKAHIYPIFNERFPGKNRFVRQKDGMQGSMEPPMVNGQYEKKDRTIALFTVNEGTYDDVKMVVKEWWIFEHDKPREEVIPFLKLHDKDEKYFSTQRAVDVGLVKKHREDVRSPRD